MRTFAIILTAFLIQLSARGIAIVGTGDPTANTGAPSGELTDSGWQYEGYWGQFTGTPISPHWFIAAQHVGRQAEEFIFQGESYTVTDSQPDQYSDLWLWRVDRSFPCWAKRYEWDDEMGKGVVMIGRGTQRGLPVYAPCPTPRVQYAYGPDQGSVYSGQLTKQQPRNAFWASRLVPVSTNIVEVSHLAGWEYGPLDGVMRWGTNVVDYSWSSTLVMGFDGGGGRNEGCASIGDSSGAVFIRDKDGTWKLDAIITAVTDYHLYVDARGISGGCELDAPLKTYTFATRLGERVNWIDSIIGSDVP